MTTNIDNENLGERGNSAYNLPAMESAPQEQRQGAREQQSARKTKGKCKAPKNKEGDRISSRGPSVNLSPSEIQYLKKLQGYIQYTEGEHYAHHELVIAGLKALVAQKYKDFKV